MYITEPIKGKSGLLFKQRWPDQAYHLSSTFWLPLRCSLSIHEQEWGIYSGLWRGVRGIEDGCFLFDEDERETLSCSIQGWDKRRNAQISQGLMFPAEVSGTCASQPGAGAVTLIRSRWEFFRDDHHCEELICWTLDFFFQAKVVFWWNFGCGRFSCIQNRVLAVGRDEHILLLQTDLLQNRFVLRTLTWDVVDLGSFRVRTWTWMS